MLGFVYVKLAQQAQDEGFDRTATTGILEGAGMGQAPYTAGRPSTVTGSLSWQNLIPAFVSDITGDPAAGGLAQAFLPLISGLLPQGVKDALSMQRRVAAGSGTVAESQEIASTLGAVNSRLMQRHAEVLAKTLAAVSTSDNVKGTKWAPAVMWLAHQVKGNPAYVGGIVAALRSADIPVISPILNQALHDTPVSYMPLITASLVENNGVLDQGLIAARVKEFEDNQAKGLYRDREGNTMDASVAIGSFGLAAEAFGDRATAGTRLELTRLADSVMKHKLASSPAAAYAIVRGLGTQKALQDPIAFDAKMAQFGSRLQRLSNADSTKAVLGALEHSAKTGMPVEHALEKIVWDGERSRAWERSGMSPQQMAQARSLDEATEYTRTKGFAEAESTKGLAAWVTQTAQGRQALDSYLENPTATAAAKMFIAARNSPTWAQRGAFDPDTIKSYLDPEAMSTLQMGEQIAFSGPMGGRGAEGGTQLQNILANWDKYRDAIEDPLSASAAQRQAIARLPYHDKKWLMSNKGLRGIAADYATRQKVLREPLPAPRMRPYETVAQEEVDAPAPELPPIKQPETVAPTPPVPNDRPSTP